MKNSFRLEFGTICITVLLTLCGCVSPKDLDNVKFELQDTQQQLQEAQRQLKDSEQQIQILQQQLKQKNSDIVIMNTCLQGVGRALSDMGDGNSSGAFTNLSSVAQECRQSDSIAEKVRVEKNKISTITVTTNN
ncbi:MULTISPECIES: hypothetical protein [Nostocales]|uniref:Lipoprotein n=3 Tax=Nostocales TaxID=1161 RepID=A0A0C1N3H3_9CYAN|nr:hypothetical protein [Tolypothrix bouteillei]KAF3889636.1 hypothetical protein DA73_0400032310 [Tolypothrix bouteillei VB521301]